MKLETSKYKLKLDGGYTNFDQEVYDAAIIDILTHRSRIKPGTKAPKEIRNKIVNARRILSQTPIMIYRGVIYFKKYNHRCSFVFHYESNPVDREPVSWAKALQQAIHAELGRYRKENLRQIIYKRNILDGYEIDIIGGRFGPGFVYSRPGQIHLIYLKRKVKDLYVAKTPEKACRYVGLELEFCAPINELDFAVKLYNAGIHKYAQIKKDGSLRPKAGEFGYELALLFPESHYRKNLRQVCKVLAEVGAKAEDRRCGLHVHIDARRRKKDVVYNNLVACQNVLFTFLDPNRRDNEFCRTVDSRTFPTKFKNDREERYKTINAAAYYKYKTIEVRMHEGSVNYMQIANWMALLIKISNHKTRIKTDIKELTTLKKRFRIDAKMKDFFQDRTCFWQLQGPQRTSSGLRFASGPSPAASYSVQVDGVANPFMGAILTGTER